MKEIFVSERRNHWQPILTGEASVSAWESVRAIATELSASKWPELDDPSLAEGCAGLALLYAYCGEAEPGDDDQEIAAQFLSRAIKLMGEMNLGPELYDGFTGVAWATAHLLRERLFDEDDDDPNKAIDDALFNYLSQSPWGDDYDLIGGLAGIGLYALERLPRASAVACLELIVERLAETAEHSAEGVAWFTRPDLLPEWQRELCPNGYYNLGLAHGVPGVIALLGGACAAGVAVERARPLLDGAVTWLLRQKFRSSAQSSFPHWTGHGFDESECRLAWCYGDAGVAASLLVAARCVNEPEWEREALSVARRAAKRKLKSAGVKDAGLCHGAAGLGHLFNRLFQATGETVFLEAARYWFERTLAMRRARRGICGFSAYRVESDGKEYWEDKAGILEGAAGIALALLAAVTDIEPSWDRMLLVSLPVALRKTYS